MAMQPQGQPDPLARWVSHALVGLGVGYILGRRGGTTGFLLMAAVGAIAHEILDAPVARKLSDAGL